MHPYLVRLIPCWLAMLSDDKTMPLYQKPDGEPVVSKAMAAVLLYPDQQDTSKKIKKNQKNGSLTRTLSP